MDHTFVYHFWYQKVALRPSTLYYLLQRYNDFLNFYAFWGVFFVILHNIVEYKYIWDNNQAHQGNQHKSDLMPPKHKETNKRYKMAKELKELTKRADNYSQWYNDLVVKADLAEQSAVRGCMVIKPYGYAIWEKMQAQLDKMFKETGAQNAYYQMIIPK